MSPTNTPDIWKWGDGRWKVHCPDIMIYREMLKWTGSEHAGIYSLPNSPREYDVLISASNLSRATKLLRTKLGRKPVVERQ